MHLHTLCMIMYTFVNLTTSTLFNSARQHLRQLFLNIFQLYCVVGHAYFGENGPCLSGVIPAKKNVISVFYFALLSEIT